MSYTAIPKFRYVNGVQPGEVYVRRAVDEKVLLPSLPGVCRYTFAATHSGKTSLINNVIPKLRAKGTLVVRIDFLTFVSSTLTMAQLFEGLCRKTAQQLEMTIPEQTRSRWQADGLSTRQIWQEILCSELPKGRSAPVWVYIDELNRLPDPAMVRELLVAIAGIIDAQRGFPEALAVRFHILGIDALGQLQPMLAQCLGSRVEATALDDFTEAEIAEALVELQSQFPHQEPRQWARLIHQATDGHPSMSIRLMEPVCTRTGALTLDSDGRLQFIKEQVKEIFLKRHTNDVCLSYMEQFLESLVNETGQVKLASGILQIYHKSYRSRSASYDPGQQSHRALYMSGLGKVVLYNGQPTIRIRNAITRQVLNETWVSKQAKQLKLSL